MAAGRCKSAATSSGFRPRSLSSRPSLPQVVVLPEPCRPHSISTVTPGCRCSEWSTGPIRSTSSWWTMPITCWRGIERLEHPFADGLLADPADEVLDDREADVGLQQGLLHQAPGPRACSLRSACLCRAAFSAPDRLSCRDSNMARTTHSRRQLDNPLVGPGNMCPPAGGLDSRQGEAHAERSPPADKPAFYRNWPWFGNPLVALARRFLNAAGLRGLVKLVNSGNTAFCAILLQIEEPPPTQTFFAPPGG